MGEGQHTRKTVAAPRSLDAIRSDLRTAEAHRDTRRLKELRAELRDAADRATHLSGSKRG